MSSGVEADIALDAAVVLTLGMNRALGRAAGAAGRGAEAMAALAAAKTEERAAALAQAEAYERALRRVLERNARIAALAETGRRLGADVPLPRPLQPTEQDVAELDAWCAATDTALDEAEASLSQHLAAQIGEQIFPRAAASLGADLGPRAETPAPGEAHESVRHRLERVVGRLLPDVSAEDRRRVAEAAALLPDASGEAEAEAVLTEVRLRVQAANARTRERREEERRRAAAREAAEQAEAERRYVLESVTAAFEELGYEVQTGFETLTAADGEVVLTRGSWAEHRVRMRVDDAAQIRAAMVRTRPAESEDDRRLDVEREREWCAAFEAARARLADAGVRSKVTWRLEPGVRDLPVTDRARRSGARQARRRERHREHG